MVLPFFSALFLRCLTLGEAFWVAKGFSFFGGT